MQKRRRYIPNLITDMAECDANFIRLEQLFPNMKEQDVLEFGIDPSNHATGSEPENLAGIEGMDNTVKVCMRIIKRCPYTTMMTVELSDTETSPWLKWPSLEVRIYHDTRSAEVVSFARHRNFKFRYTSANPKMYQPDEKAQINRYLGELLCHCAEYGHSLEAVSFVNA